MKSPIKRKIPIPHAHWKLKWGWRQHCTTGRSKIQNDAFDTQEFRNTSFPDVITF
ncbi:hypothetical protein [Runella sp.]|uniref:hypothetical protein n=1 Tax=Runella sp. TaxID=1960881 RepID=UPI003D1131A3